MKKYVKAAEYKYYNANSRGSHVGDCVKRAISLAFDVPYAQVTKDINKVLNNYKQETHMWNAQWNRTSVWSRLVAQYGGGPRVDVPEHPTEDEFADAHDGTYIVLSGKFNQYGKRSQGHACCIIDHVIYDSWNSKNHRVYGYFKISDSGQHKKETGIDKQIPSLAGLASELIEELSLKYVNKYNIPGGIPDISHEYTKKGYAFKCAGQLRFSSSVEESKYLKPYDLSVTIVLTPTTTVEEAEEIIKKSVYQKIYDKFYYIRKDIESKKEAHELSLASEYDKTDPDYLFIDGREERFLKSLPAWVSQFLTYIDIQQPNQYSDSVKVTIRPLPSDPRGGESKFVKFEAYNTTDMRDMLARYKKNYERPWEDYDPSEEY